MTVVNYRYNPVPEKYQALQLLRFIAAFMVIILHSTYYASERLTIGSILYDEGGNGVALFFVISGFVMVISSQRLIDQADGWKIFAVKRIVRIVPIYWLIITLKLAMMTVNKSFILHANLDPIFILKSYFFIPALNPDGLYMPFYGVGWTLNFEIFFYALFAIALAFKVKPMLFLSATFLPLYLLSYFKTQAWGALGFYADPIIINFLLGMVSAYLILSGRKIGSGLGCVIIVVSLLYLFIPRTGFLDFLPMNHYLKVITAFLAVYCGASLSARFSAKIPNLFIYLGGASYSLYLVHPFVAPAGPVILGKLKILSTELSVMMSVGIAIAIGVVFYKICEVPFTRMATKLTKNNKVAAVVVQAKI